ncbi:MAG: hypothetical protein K2X98_03210 [Alphaproteobacteria bacterium]|nr:hypothetical protein [Alphaproteobacteria bacterium]
MILCLMLVSCRHGKAPWDQKEFDHTHLDELKKPVETIMDDEGPIPPRKTKPKAPTLPDAFKKNISLSLTENVSLKNVLPEVARHIGVDLQLDPKIDEKLVFQATDQPFMDVIDQLCDLANLRYKVMGKSLRVEKDTPYSKNYNVQFLNLSRSTENHVSIATDVFANSRKTNSVIGDNGSNSSVNMTNENDFWKELDANLHAIMDHGDGGTFSMHKQGGLVSVQGTEKQHRQVRTYLRQLRKVATTQVLIEAKVIEVTLTDQYRSGINWQKIAGKSPRDLRFNAPLGTLAQNARLLNPADAQSDVITIGGAGQSFSAILSAIEQFGVSRTLSSPRLTALNNQTAILKVARNEVYFRLNYNRQYNTNVARESFNVSSDIQTVPIGLVMSVQPSIDEESGEIILNLRPTISRLTGSVRDPAVDIAYNANANANGNTNTTAPIPSVIPVVEVREIDSVLRLKDGEVGILGGLMQTNSTQDRSQLPGIGNAPIIGELVKERVDSDMVVELVILMRAKIVAGAPEPDDADDRLYNNYTDDPRRFI